MSRSVDTTGISGAHAAAIILARAGSRGVPGKNVAVVGGRPCVAWTIDAAFTALGVARVALSTDDPLAASIAERMGCEVVSRPAALASDTARVDDAARHAAAALNLDAAQPIVLLYANVPIRPPGLIDAALDLLRATGCDSVQSYEPVGKRHPWWTARLHDDARVGPWEGDVLNHGVYRRQDLPPAWVPDGGVLALTQAALFEHAGSAARAGGADPGPHAFLGQDRRGIRNPEGAVIDIDTPTDLIVADALLSRAARQRSGVTEAAA